MKEVNIVSKVKQASMRAMPRITPRRTPSRATPLRGTVEVRELDPVRMCGPGTSVRLMYRVIERVDGGLTNHLVYFDRHGWYCEHGRACAAVSLARKRTGRISA